MENFGIKDLKNILIYYDNSIPTTIFRLKKKANFIIVSKLFLSNCNKNKNYKKLFYLLNKRRIISNQKKNKYEKTKKKYSIVFKQTRVRSPISYLVA